MEYEKTYSNPCCDWSTSCISNCFESYIEKIGVQVVQKTALLGTANILRKALSKLDISYDMGGPLSTCY